MGGGNKKTEVHYYPQPIYPQQPPQQTTGRFCPDCGRAIPMDAQLCPYCGTKFK